jgi:hypothetical protein
MLEYLYHPQSDTFVREKCPIRDIGSVWNVQLLSNFLNKRGLEPLIEKSLEHFSAYIVEHDGYGPRRLNEPSTIAHSAFMMLALLNAAQRHRSTNRCAGRRDSATAET